MKIALAQINPIIADISGNTEKICSFALRAKELGADVAVFPEMCITGYPPMDLLENEKLIDDNLAALEYIGGKCGDIVIVCGYVDRDEEISPALLNSAAVIKDGKIISRHHKSLLPTYDVFDEQRYFSPSRDVKTVNINGKIFGITICEDIWNDRDLLSGYIEGRKYETDPVKKLSDGGAEIILNLSASPYVTGKNSIKRSHISAISRKYALPVVYVNQIGGNDSLIFDGNSFAVNDKGEIASECMGFSEDLVFFDTENCPACRINPENELEDIKNALVLGVRDYMKKCGFNKAVLGLSGGIDSALTAAIAVMAVGAENVAGITMPSVFSSAGSVDDSAALAENLGIKIDVIPIKELCTQFEKDLAPVFNGAARDVTEENIQARVRGNLLMAVSNKTGALLLTTGNKSELAMGYCTLYGDMSGGLAVISDLPKTLVFKLAAYLNSDKEIIPWNTINKPPSAELRENQKDEDSLPPYDILDGILDLYISKRLSLKEITARGFDEETVHSVLRAVDRNEYKRRQAATGLKITGKAFGIGRRIPMAQKFMH
ncbi:MAG: NAD+ synthase [Spirochaetes bacterium]|nr:NAD+ synthase [Spirochaetota bacterium]